MSVELSHHEQLLDQVMQEPMVSKLREELTTYNALILESSDVEVQEIEQVIDDLNERYMPMFSNGATISGYMEFPKPGSRELETGDFEIEHRYYDEQDVEVYGFVLASESIKLSDDDILSRPLIGLNIGRNIDPEERELEEDDVTMYTGMVRPERVDIAPFTMSPERARAWLEYHYPDALVDLETRILNTNNEADSLVNLTGFSVRLDPETIDRSRQAFSVYLNSMLRFDMNVPYMAHMEGFVYVPEEEAHSKGFISDGQYLAYFHEFFMVPDDLEESPTHIPMVELSVINPDFEGEDHDLLSEIGTIKSASSIRQTYYGN